MGVAVVVVAVVGVEGGVGAAVLGQGGALTQQGTDLPRPGQHDGLLPAAAHHSDPRLHLWVTW